MNFLPVSNPARWAAAALFGMLAIPGIPGFLGNAAAADTTLREAYADDFTIGVALNTSMVNGRNKEAGELAGKHFSSITAENDMKWQSLHP